MSLENPTAVSAPASMHMCDDVEKPVTHTEQIFIQASRPKEGLQLTYWNTQP